MAQLNNLFFPIKGDACPLAVEGTVASKIAPVIMFLPPVFCAM